MAIGTTVIVIVLAIVVLVVISLSTRATPKGIDKEHFKNEWNDVLALFKEEKSRPLSVVHADKLLDQA